MKKISHNKIIIASVILVLIVSLAACSGKTDGDTPDETSETNLPESSATVSEDKDTAVDNPEDAKTESVPVETQPETKPESTQPAEKPAKKPAETHTDNHHANQSTTKLTEHTHNWVEHHIDIPVWVDNIVPIYETQTVQTTKKVSDGWFWHCNCGAKIPSGSQEVSDHAVAHIEADEPDNGYDREVFHDEIVYEEKQVQVGTKDEGYWETQTYVDYVYCSECGAKK